MEEKIKLNIKKVNQTLNGEASWHLNAMRGVAAVMVLMNHFRNTFFVTYQDVENQNIFTLLLYSFTGLGHEAVMVFFVLSGFLISNSILKVLNNWSWKHYLINRLTRLSVVLIPALILGLIIDLTGLYFFDYSFFPHNMDERINVEVFLGNLLYLQGFQVSVLGTNDPLWSLSYEFWYYLLFPAILLTITKTKGLWTRFSYLIFTFICFFIVGKEVSFYFLVWLMGFVVLIFPAIKIESKVLIASTKIGSVLLFIITLGVSRLNLISLPLIEDILVAISFSLLVYLTLHLQNVFNATSNLKEWYRNSAEWLSGFSYTLYLIHFPILIFLFALFSKFGMEKAQPSVLSILSGIILCISISIVAYLFSLVTENKTKHIKELIYALIASAGKSIAIGKK